jgi:hypothetical protein
MYKYGLDRTHYMGSGGGTGVVGQDCDKIALGGRGGGHICIVATDTIDIDGIITAIGKKGKPNKDQDRGGGGGSGGAILLKAKYIMGGSSGKLSVKGGAGSSAYGDPGGGGAGGNLFLLAENMISGVFEIDYSGGDAGAPVGTEHFAFGGNGGSYLHHGDCTGYIGQVIGFGGSSDGGSTYSGDEGYSGSFVPMLAYDLVDDPPEGVQYASGLIDNPAYSVTINGSPVPPASITGVPITRGVRIVIVLAVTDFNFFGDNTVVISNLEDKAGNISEVFEETIGLETAAY